MSAICAFRKTFYIGVSVLTYSIINQDDEHERKPKKNPPEKVFKVFAGRKSWNFFMFPSAYSLIMISKNVLILFAKKLFHSL